VDFILSRAEEEEALAAAAAAETVPYMAYAPPVVGGPTPRSTATLLRNESCTAVRYFLPDGTMITRHLTYTFDSCFKDGPVTLDRHDIQTSLLRLLLRDNEYWEFLQSLYSALDDTPYYLRQHGVWMQAAKRAATLAEESGARHFELGGFFPVCL
jgi:hypothetical protein